MRISLFLGMILFYLYYLPHIGSAVWTYVYGVVFIFIALFADYHVSALSEYHISAFVVAYNAGIFVVYLHI